MTISNLGLIFCPTLLIGSLLFTALVNHVGTVFPLPRRSNPKESEIAPSSSVSVSRDSKRTLRNSLLRTPAANRIPPPRPPRSPSTLSKLNPKPMKANEIRPNPSTVSRPSEVPTGDLIDFDSPIMTESPGSSENRHNITSDQEDDTESDTSEDSSSSSESASPDHSRKDDSGLVSIDIDGNGLNTGILNLNIRRSAANRNSPHIATPTQHPSVLDESLDNAQATPNTSGLALQNPILPSKPQRLTRKLTPRTSTKYVKDMLDLVDH
ncbi:hypothetical protein K7432_012424 [Basidiobolus ranarum]|uniref:Uncharacterized protein n=1 Tax=Basidiobolus ranarum TaxID=34480 RepID=A0ABR2VSE8_9FUNG